MRLRLLCPLLVLGACGHEYTLTDDIDLTWDFGITLSKFGDTLHTPYVRGSTMGLSVYSKDEDDRFDGWSIESDDPSIFTITSVTAQGRNLGAAGVAASEGTTEIRVFDDHGDYVGGGEADVRQPDNVRLDAHGYLIMDMDDQASVDEVRVVEGGTATFVVNYFQGTTALHGNGTLSADGTLGISAQGEQTFLFENREWVQVSSNGDAGPVTLPLRSDGDLVANVPVVVVPETEISNVTMFSESESGHKDGDWLVAYAQAFDSSQRRIFGVEYSWDVNGVEQTADGDLYRYEFKSGDYETVTASRNGMSDSTVIQSDDGFVDSTNHIGCSAGGGGAGLVAGLALVGLARRRRRV
jgi:hypothetical protein